MNIEANVSDKRILAEIGHRLGRRRVDLGLTQAQLAKEAGVAKRTVERVEAGESTQFATMLRILRVLELLDALDAAIPAPGPRPMDLLKLKGKERQRASTRKGERDAEGPWSWGDDA